MIELGAAVGCKNKPIIARFEAIIRPVTNEVIVSKESFERAKLNGIDPTDAMMKFAEWCQPYIKDGAYFIARPAAFDWPWVVYYAWTYLGKNPFGFSAVCASSWLKALGKDFVVTIPHIAVDDAEIQLRHFLSEG